MRGQGSGERLRIRREDELNSEHDQRLDMDEVRSVARRFLSEPYFQTRGI